MVQRKLKSISGEIFMILGVSFLLQIFFSKTGCQDVECLRGLSGDAINQATPWNEYPFWAMEDLGGMPVPGQFDGALLVVDGKTIHSVLILK